jgi:guanine deaminase
MHSTSEVSGKVVAKIIALRGSIFHSLADPKNYSEATAEKNQCFEYFEDGIVVISAEKIVALGSAASILPTLSYDVEVRDCRGKFIMPGFIDTHIHYAQTDIIAAYGTQLLDWLNRYAFPEEMLFADAQYAREVADFFMRELLRNGTTSAQVFATVHAQSVDVLFAAAEQRGMALIAGKVMMDQNCPPQLADTAETSYVDSRALIERWHNNGRLRYAVTPRFAPTSSDAQLKKVQQLVTEYPDIYMQTHLSENKSEVEWVAQLFPWSKNYLDVYAHYGLLRPRSTFAHCIHLSADEHEQLANTGAAISCCPTSNLFLGSGLFNFKTAEASNTKLSFGTDIGGGSSFSMLRTMHEAYKVAQLRGDTLTPLKAFYIATKGAAKALHRDDEIGCLSIGQTADLIIIDPKASEICARRIQTAQTLSEKLFILMMLGDDRHIAQTWVAGQCAHRVHIGTAL